MKNKKAMTSNFTALFRVLAISLIGIALFLIILYFVTGKCIISALCFG